MIEHSSLFLQHTLWCLNFISNLQDKQSWGFSRTNHTTVIHMTIGRTKSKKVTFLQYLIAELLHLTVYINFNVTLKIFIYTSL